MQRVRIEERPGWRTLAEQLGFAFHTIDGETYWDESAYYRFTLRQVEDDIEDPTAELHAMAMAFVDEAVASEELLTRLAIPEAYWDWVRASWRDAEPHVYGRMDLAYDGNGPAKLYELNYDTPTSLYESAYFQWVWLEQGIHSGALPRDADQYNRIQEALCEAFAALARARRIAGTVHFAAMEDVPEDHATITYLRDCAHQAGVDTAEVAIERIGLSEDGWFTDTGDRVIRTLFKLYPLEFMMADAFGPALAARRVQLIEPAWKAVLSNKAVLPLLWERHEGHPNLLPAHFATPGQREVPMGWVRKPLFSREGANITLRAPTGERMASDGPYDDGRAILQAYHPLPRFEGGYPLVGSWVVADAAVGMGLREDATRITRNTSRFVPHVILG